MGLNDWILSISASTIAIILGVATYFAQKWIQSVDETLKEHSGDFKALTKQISTLESKQSAQAENISKTIHTQLATIKLPHVKIDKIDEEVSLIKIVIQEKLLPHADKQADHLGRVLVLEDNVREQNTKLITMFNALKILVFQKQKDQAQAPGSKPE
jgi:uncharacterized protein YoxC